jgi:hypothetical protein
MNQPELAQATLKHRARRVARTLERFTAARVTVTWTPSGQDAAAPLASAELELVAGISSAAHRHWTCPRNFGSSWLEAISPARCSEVVLTARLGDDLSAKHLVLELAELLTLKLTETRPLIRVRFLTTEPSKKLTRGPRNHA